MSKPRRKPAPDRSTELEITPVLLRDYFAAAALTGVLRTTIRTDNPETIAERCYRIADAMMAEREPRP